MVTVGHCSSASRDDMTCSKGKCAMEEGRGGKEKGERKEG